jgi:hypothetical protein
MVCHMVSEVDASYKMPQTNFTTDHGHIFGGEINAAMLLNADFFYNL